MRSFKVPSGIDYLGTILKLSNETKVGLVATITIALLVLGFKFLKGDKLFQNNFELKAYYDNIDGLTAGNPVIYSGFRVGSVKSIDIDKKNGKIEVVFNLEKGLEIPVNSYATISSADLLGSKVIRIDRGDAKQIAESGQSLDGRVDKDLSSRVIEEILPLKGKVEEMIEQMGRFMGWLNNTMDESAGNKVENILDDFATTSRNFARTSYRIDTLLGSFQSTAHNANKIVKNFSNQSETINRIMSNAAVFTDSIAASATNVKAMVQQTSDVIADLEGILRKIDQGEGALGAMMTDRSLYDNLNVTIARVDTLIRQFTLDPKVKLEHSVNLFNNDKRVEKRKRKEDQKLEKSRSLVPDEGGK